MLFLQSSAEGNFPHPEVDSFDICWEKGYTDHECESGQPTICYCCYSDGCWICDHIYQPQSCVWDPKYGTRLETAPQTEPPSISPESGQRFKPPFKPPSVAVHAGPTVINFDDVITGGLGTGGPISVTDQYASQGVSFNSPVAVDFSKGNSIPDFAHSGTIAIEQCYAAEFCTAPIEIKFNQGQSRVKVWVGYDSALQEKTPVILRAFDASGNQIARAEANLAEQGPIPIQIPLEVSTINTRNRLLTKSNIIRVTVDFRDENRYTNGLAVDDVEFERVEGIMPEILPTTVKA